MATRRHTSNIWAHYERAENKFAICNICKSKLSYKTSITNLKRHMSNKHATVSLRNEDQLGQSDSSLTVREGVTLPTQLVNETGESDIPDVTPGTSQSHMRSTTAITGQQQQRSMQTYLNPKKMSTSQKDKIDQLVMQMLIKDYQPFSIVEDEGFRNLIKILAPGYQIPSRKYLSKSLLDKMYDDCYKKVTNNLKEVKGICITTDHWTSAANESYIGVTAHYINDNFKLCSVLLQCIKFEGAHTAVAIATELRRVLNCWNLRHKLVIAVTDNASNVTKAIKDELKWKHYGCFAHKLNLIVERSLGIGITATEGERESIFLEIKRLIDKIKSIVSHFRRSSQANEKLLKTQQQTGVEQPLTVIKDVVTRWNSTFYMIERFVLLKESIRSTIANLNVPHLTMLDEREWAIAEEVTIILRPFEEATKEMSGENFLTASKIISISRGLEKVTESAINRRKIYLIEPFAKCLIKETKNRFDKIEYSKTIGICTFLDPRFKQYVFEDSTALSVTQNDIID